jgi:hypothetical protein
VSFTKSGNHDSSFTQVDMRALVSNDDDNYSDSIGSNNTINSDKEADELAQNWVVGAVSQTACLSFT